VCTFELELALHLVPKQGVEETRMMRTKLDLTSGFGDVLIRNLARNNGVIRCDVASNVALLQVFGNIHTAVDVRR
jgi:hypothetical protein